MGNAAAPSPGGRQRMSKSNVNLQDGFLNEARREGLEVKVALVNGQELLGAIHGFDNFTIVLHTDGRRHLVYKHAIAQLTADTRPQRLTPSGDGAPVKTTEQQGDPKGLNRLDLSDVNAEPSV